MNISLKLWENFYLTKRHNVYLCEVIGWKYSHSVFEIYIVAVNSKKVWFCRIFGNILLHWKEINFSLINYYSEYEQITDNCRSCLHSFKKYLTENCTRKLTKMSLEWSKKVTNSYIFSWFYFTVPQKLQCWFIVQNVLTFTGSSWHKVTSRDFK